MPLRDFKCTTCNLFFEDIYGPKDFDDAVHLVGAEKCGVLEIQYNLRKQDASVHSTEKAVVFYHPKHGFRYPGRNDTPMPKEYKKSGFERLELTSLRDLQRLEKQAGVVNERVHFDRGSGRDFTNT